METVTRETVETFHNQRTEYKVTTEKKATLDSCPSYLIEALTEKAQNPTTKSFRQRRLKMSLEFQNACLKVHNQYRQRHGAPPLKLSPKLSAISQKWADHLLKLGRMQHSSDGKYGENLFMAESSKSDFMPTAESVVKSWYDEISKYNFGDKPIAGTGHFTQLVWKGSEELGIGLAKKGGKVVVVANYSPPGNIIGRFKENVLPEGTGVASKSPRDLKLGETDSNGNNYTTSYSAPSTLTKSISKLSLKSFKSNNNSDFLEDNFEENFLKAHNYYRQKHGVPQIKLDRKLCKYSEEWAKHLASRNILETRPRSNYGENIYCLKINNPDFKLSGQSVVDQWYEEIEKFHFGREPNDLKAGNFTQLIWKSSEYLGVAVARSSAGTIYLVANYSPAGNFVGSYVENVPPVKPRLSGLAPLKAPSATVKENVKLTQDMIKKFVKEVLAAHNEYRRKHSVPELKLNDDMCKLAQDWATHCADTHILAHRPNCPYGENVFCLYNSDFSQIPTAKEPVKQWYDEIREYDFDSDKVNPKTLHFTQVVWRNSTELGVGIAKNDKGETYVVANYNPRGNYVGHFKENVLRPLIK